MRYNSLESTQVNQPPPPPLPHCLLARLILLIALCLTAYWHEAFSLCLPAHWHEAQPKILMGEFWSNKSVTCMPLTFMVGAPIGQNSVNRMLPISYESVSVPYATL